MKNLSFYIFLVLFFCNIGGQKLHCPNVKEVIIKMDKLQGY
jgi:hypothetical protein